MLWYLMNAPRELTDYTRITTAVLDFTLEHDALITFLLCTVEYFIFLTYVPVTVQLEHKN